MANIDTNAYLEDAVGGPQLHGVRVYRHSLGASDEPSANDHLRFFKLPKNAKIAFAGMAMTDMDTNGSPALEVDLILSDGSTDKILIEGSTQDIGQTGGSEDMFDLVGAATNEPGLGFVTDSDDWYVAADWKVVAATFAAGTITVSVIYTTVLDGGA